VISVPRILISEYPTPLPASLVATTDGVKFKISGKSCPVLRDWIFR